MSMLSVVHYCENCLYNQRSTLLVYLLSVVLYCENFFFKQPKEQLTGVFVICSSLM